MEEEFIRIPKDRIAVLIGPQGKTKKAIEKQTMTSIKINSSTGDVEIINKAKTDTGILKAKDIITGIARGFSPEHALLLLNDQFFLEVINLTELVGTKNSKILNQKKGRVIGRNGKSRNQIEELTNTNVSVYGKTVSIIGEFNGLQTAKEAILMLLEGANHSNVFDFLEKHKHAKQKLEI